MDPAKFGKALETAWEKRSALRGRTTAFRLLNGAASGTPGLIADMFSGYLVLYAYDTEFLLDAGDPVGRQVVERLVAVTGAKGISLKDRTARGEDGRDEGRDLYGEVPETADVEEGALGFRVHPRHPRNVGLFLDTRPLRERLVSSCDRHDVLNLFSYSCSLGIAAAKENLGTVCNVDVSARYLGWGKENLALNGLPAERTRFARMDSEKYLDWAAKKSLAYDVVILDPPSFSRSEGGTFAFARDYWRLVEKGARLLRPRGRFYALTNYGGIAPDTFRKAFRDALRAGGRDGGAITRLRLPEDFDGAGEADAFPLPGGNARATVEGTLLACEAILP